MKKEITLNALAERTIRVKNIVLPLSLSPIGRIVSFVVSAYRIPARGEWFLNKLDEPVKAKSTSLSKRARRKPILQRTK